MIQLKDVHFTIADRQLFRDLSWTIKSKKRIGLIGPNGAGKTTLLRLLTGQLEITSGEIIIPKNTSIGYLPQEEINFKPIPVINIVLEGHYELQTIDKEIQHIQNSLNNKQDPALIEKLGRLQDRFNLLGGYQIESEAKKILSGLGFSQNDFDKTINTFSGGWRMRVHLARLLLQKPDFLLMDEPTNHLDIHSLEWVEEYLQTFPGTIILVSHDRLFLDRLVNEIADLDKGKIKVYTGNYTFFEIKKEEQEQQLLKNYQAQQAERERLQKFIDRFRYKATKAAQVQSRIKMLEKMDLIELPDQTNNFSFKIKADVTSYKDVLTINDLSFAYNENAIFDHFNFKVTRGEKIALVGDNGEGKTTLTKLIFGDLKPKSGIISYGQRVNIGYYAQHQSEALDITKSIYDEIEQTAAPSFRTRLRDILGLFRFHGDDINKKIAVLSGGEKARVSLAKILLSPCNFLIMDEPTNHLDIDSKKALENALCTYNGTLLTISHDRYFLDRIVHRVVELKNGTLFDYPGNYSYYLEKRKHLHQSEQALLLKQDNSTKEPGSVYKSKNQKRMEAEARKSVSRERNFLQKRIDEIENILDNNITRKNEIDKILANPDTYNDAELTKNMSIEYKEIEKLINELEQEWEEKHLKLERLLLSMK